MKIGPLQIEWGRAGPPDPDAFFADLAASHPGKNYSKMDRYRDFRHLFLGSEQGKRVLFEILLWGHITRPSAPLAKFETNETMFLDGERSLAVKIMTTMNAEPQERKE